LLGEGRSIGQVEEISGVAGRLEHLFGVVTNPKTGKRYANAEVARMTLSDLSEEEVERIRTGTVSDPTVGQVATLAGVFGVEPSYLLDREKQSLLDEELVQALRDETVRDITRESSRLPDRERQLVLGIVWQFRDQKAASSDQSRLGLGAQVS
jgi:transcriptional regulator with XRE-family HTH domain